MSSRGSGVGSGSGSSIVEIEGSEDCEDCEECEDCGDCGDERRVASVLVRFSCVGCFWKTWPLAARCFRASIARRGIFVEAGLG